MFRSLSISQQMACVKVLYILSDADGRVHSAEWDIMNRLAQVSHNPAWAIADLKRLRNHPTCIEAQLSLLNTAPDEARRWILNSLAQVANADGVLHPKEREVLELFARQLDLSNQDVEGALQHHFGSVHAAEPCVASATPEGFSETYKRAKAEFQVDPGIFAASSGIPDEVEDEDKLLAELLSTMRLRRKKTLLSSLVEELSAL